MKFAVTVPPALDPISIAEAKAHCRVTSTDEDGLIAGYILAARQYVESICGMALITQTVEAYFDSFALLMLPRWPVQSVTSISYLDNAGAAQTLSPSDYHVNSKARPAYVSRTYTGSWPDTYTRDNAVTVTLVVGFGDSPGSIPEPVRMAMLLLIGNWYENREATSPTTMAEIPFAAATLLAPYRVFY